MVAHVCDIITSFCPLCAWVRYAAMYFSEEKEQGARGITTTTTQLIIVYVTGYRNTTKMGRLSQSSILVLWLSLFFSLSTQPTFLTKMEKNDKRVWWSTTMHHFSGLGPSHSPCCRACPTQKMCGTTGWRFLFSRSSITTTTIIIIIHTYFILLTCNVWDWCSKPRTCGVQFTLCTTTRVNNKGNGRDAAATFSCALFTAC